MSRQSGNRDLKALVDPNARSINRLPSNRPEGLGRHDSGAGVPAVGVKKNGHDIIQTVLHLVPLYTSHNSIYV